MKLTKNLLALKRAIQIAAVFWTVLVAYLCLANSESLPSVAAFQYDKIGHFTFHFGITIVWFLFWKTTYKNENKYALLKAFLFSFFFGILIEIAQMFTITRKAELVDLLANTNGALVAVLVIYIFNLIRR